MVLLVPSFNSSRYIPLDMFFEIQVKTFVLCSIVFFDRKRSACQINQAGFKILEFSALYLINTLFDADLDKSGSIWIPVSFISWNILWFPVSALNGSIERIAQGCRGAGIPEYFNGISSYCGRIVLDHFIRSALLVEERPAYPMSYKV